MWIIWVKVSFNIGNLIFIRKQSSHVMSTTKYTHILLRRVFYRFILCLKKLPKNQTIFSIICRTCRIYLVNWKMKTLNEEFETDLKQEISKGERNSASSTGRDSISRFGGIISSALSVHSGWQKVPGFRLHGIKRERRNFACLQEIARATRQRRRRFRCD